AALPPDPPGADRALAAAPADRDVRPPPGGAGRPGHRHARRPGLGGAGDAAAPQPRARRAVVAAVRRLRRRDPPRRLRTGHHHRDSGVDDDQGQVPRHPGADDRRAAGGGGGGHRRRRGVGPLPRHAARRRRPGTRHRPLRRADLLARDPGPAAVLHPPPLAADRRADDGVLRAAPPHRPVHRRRGADRQRQRAVGGVAPPGPAGGDARTRDRRRAGPPGAGQHAAGPAFRPRGGGPGPGVAGAGGGAAPCAAQRPRPRGGGGRAAVRAAAVGSGADRDDVLLAGPRPVALPLPRRPGLHRRAGPRHVLRPVRGGRQPADRRRLGLGRPEDPVLVNRRLIARWRQAGATSRRLLVTGAVITAGFGVVALLAPVLAPYGQAAHDMPQLAHPSLAHWFGTTNLRFDVLSRVLFGARLAFEVVLAST